MTRLLKHLLKHMQDTVYMLAFLSKKYNDLSVLFNALWIPLELLRRFCLRFSIDVRLPLLVSIKSPKGLQIIWMPRTGSEIFGLLRDIWVYEEYALPRELCHKEWEPHIVIDGGAHVGVFSLYAAKILRAKYIVAIEPEGENFRLLLQNLTKNKVKGLCLKVALYKDSIVPLRKDLASIAHSVVATPKRFQGIELVRSISLHTLLKLLYKLCGVEQIDILKLDIEGAEISLLQDSEDLLKHHKILLLFIDLSDTLRVHGIEKAMEIIKLLSSSGYKVKIRKAGNQEIVLTAVSPKCI